MRREAALQDEDRFATARVRTLFALGRAVHEAFAAGGVGAGTKQWRGATPGKRATAKGKKTTVKGQEQTQQETGPTLVAQLPQLVYTGAGLAGRAALAASGANKGGGRETSTAGRKKPTGPAAPTADLATTDTAMFWPALLAEIFCRGRHFAGVQAEMAAQPALARAQAEAIVRERKDPDEGTRDPEDVARQKHYF